MQLAMFWHIDTDIVSLLVVTALHFYQTRLPQKSDNRFLSRRFSICLQIGIGLTIIDIAASIAMDMPVSRFAFHFFMTLYLATVEMVIVEWFLYAAQILYHDDERRFRIIYRCVMGSYLVYALFACLNPWTGAFFTLGPDNAYARGPLFMLMVVVYAVYTISLLLLILLRWKHIPAEYPGTVLLLVPLILAVAIAVQLLNPGWLMIMPAYMLCLVLSLLFFQTVRTKDNQALMRHLHEAAETDRLTGLLNRAGMEARVARALAEHGGEACLLVLVDIDDLKDINDTMGHGEGDRAIRSVAGQLREHFRATDIVARYGGDEFLVFLAGSLSETQVNRSLRQLVAELGALRIGRRDDVPIHGSAGAAFDTVGAKSFETLCHEADAALYHVKRNGKNGCAVYRPGMEREMPGEDRRREAPVS